MPRTHRLLRAEGKRAERSGGSAGGEKKGMSFATSSPGRKRLATIQGEKNRARKGLALRRGNSVKRRGYYCTSTKTRCSRLQAAKGVLRERGLGKITTCERNPSGEKKKKRGPAQRTSEGNC